MQSYVIYLIRHGSVDETLKGKYIGSTDVHLSQKGIHSLQNIKKDHGYPHPQAVFSSPLTRCTETCSIIYPDNEIKTVGELSECSFGDWEGKSAVELAGDPSFVSWLQNSDQFPPPHGESGKQFALRICKAFEHTVNEVISSNITASAIITHGGIIMTLLSVYGIPQAQSHQWRMDNGYGFAVRVTPSLWFRDKIVEVFDTVPFAPKPKKSSHDDMEFFE